MSTVISGSGTLSTNSDFTEICLDESRCDVRTFGEAVDEVMAHAEMGDGVLGVVSINLDHLHRVRTGTLMPARAPGVRWLALIDGAPLALRATRVAGRSVPRLAGSDLIAPMLERMASAGLRFGILGGEEESQHRAAEVLRERVPGLVVAGMWSPAAEVLADEERAAAVADDIAAAGVDVLMVCLGKPKQEHWIARWGERSGARVCLAFGGVVDLLAGKIPRSPRWMSRVGLEWAWRLAHEPVRLSRRYLVEGPPALYRLQRHAHLPTPLPTPDGTAAERTFASNDGHADVTALVITFNSQNDIGDLIDSLRAQRGRFSLRVLVCDNGSSDDTLAIVRRHPDVHLVLPERNLGYAGGINLLRRFCGPTDQFLVLNPDLVLGENMVDRLRGRLAAGAGAAVPLVLAACGRVSQSLRREPSVARSWGDALLGQFVSRRPPAFAEEVPFGPAYQHPHPIDWATGAALLVDATLHRRVGDWDERFFLYSEETDFMRRIRELGSEIWFEPTAVVRHRQGGSGSSPELKALLQVNKARYFEKWHRFPGTTLQRAALVATGLLRWTDRGHRLARRVLTGQQDLRTLPGMAERIPEQVSLAS